jgi:uncharacterized protein (DUF1330 family)
MAAYAIGLLNMNDTAWLGSYLKPTAETIAKFGGRYLARGGKAEVLEGEFTLPGAVVMLEFPSMEQAKAWYGSSDYAPLKTLRQASSTLQFILVDGLPPRK